MGEGEGEEKEVEEAGEAGGTPAPRDAVGREDEPAEVRCSSTSASFAAAAILGSVTLTYH